MKSSLPFFLSLALISLPAHAAKTYEEAKAQGKADATNPDTRAWYLNDLRPAFSKFFGPALNDCIASTSADQVKGLGLVFTVTVEGKVKQIFWKGENAFSACMDEKLKSSSFPNAPVPEFFVGLEIG